MNNHFRNFVNIMFSVGCILLIFGICDQSRYMFLLASFLFFMIIPILAYDQIKKINYEIKENLDIILSKIKKDEDHV